MPREVRPELQILLNSGICRCNTTMDVKLTSGTELFWSSGDIHVDRFGKNQQYLAKLAKSGIGTLEMSVDPEVDGQDFKALNTDMVIGQLFTGATRQFDGAEVISGVLYKEIGADESDSIWDAKMKGELTVGEITDPTVQFELVSAIDSVIISGRTVFSEFQWMEPMDTAPTGGDPNDTPTLPSPYKPGGRYLDEDPYVPSDYPFDIPGTIQP